MKKAQGISMNVIVIAALALLVLVVLAVIFLGRMTQTNKQMDNCKQYDGVCISSSDSCPASSPIPYAQYKCYDASGNVQDDVKCCIKGS